MSHAADSITDINIGSFSTHSRYEADSIAVKLRGNADMAVHEQLRLFFDDLHRRMLAARLKEVVFNLEDLYFMNSSCLSLLLRLINSIQESRTHHAYTLRFRSNPNLYWQRRSLESIHTYAKGIVLIE